MCIRDRICANVRWAVSWHWVSIQIECEAKRFACANCRTAGSQMIIAVCIINKLRVANYITHSFFARNRIRSAIVDTKKEVVVVFLLSSRSVDKSLNPIGKYKDIVCLLYTSDA